jgi:hypothetical protein
VLGCGRGATAVPSAFCIEKEVVADSALMNAVTDRSSRASGVKAIGKRGRSSRFFVAEDEQVKQQRLALRTRERDVKGLISKGVG